MRRAVVVALFLAWAPAAQAAPAVSIEAPSLVGQAPFEVTLTASGTANSFSWDFGDGSGATGRTVTHTYATGRFTATVTATVGGESAQAAATITAATISLSAPKAGTYGQRLAVTGRITPAIPGAQISLQTAGLPVAAARANGSGRFRFRTRLGHPASYEARFGTIVSNAVSPAVRPRLDLSLPRARVLGERLALAARVRPLGSGAIEVRVWLNGRRRAARSLGAGGRLALSSRQPAEYVVQVLVRPAGGFAAVSRTLSTSVYVPYLGPGSRGPSVRILERRLAQLRYALRGVDGYYATDTYEAVLAFQKVSGLARTGRVDPGLWRRVQRAGIPRVRYPRAGHHLEVDKRRQVLFEVRGGGVARVVHVSTGATGNTPVGRWHVYRKVGGWDWILWYPMYFLRGFAVHGYPSVPAYPASHGCVRVPMWIAPKLFTANPFGQTIYVY